MLIAEFEAEGHSETVCAIGSCRVHNPLKAMVAAKRGTYVWYRFNAFTHSAPEAIQYLGFCRGQIDLPPESAPYIFLKDELPVVPSALAAHIERCTTFVVELSSANLLTCGPWVFQQDYFWQKFVRGNGLVVLEWWRHLRNESKRAATADAALAALRAAERPVAPFAEEILFNANLRTMPDMEVMSGIAALKASVGSRRMILIPHFNWSTEPGEFIAERARIADLLRAHSDQVGFEVFDPSPLVAKAGRKVALAGDGVDIHHFSPEFDGVVGDALLRTVSSEFALISDSQLLSSMSKTATSRGSR